MVRVTVDDYARAHMSLSRPFTARQLTILGLVGALALCVFFILPQGQAAASTLLILFRGQAILPVPSDLKQLKSAYDVIDELKELGTMQGSIPRQLNTVASIGAAKQVTGFTTIAQPGTVPASWSANVGRDPAVVKAIGAREVILTFDKAKADAYFSRIGSSQKFPEAYNGVDLIVDFPPVSLLEYVAPPGGGKLYVGQAGQLEISTSGNVSFDALKTYLTTVPGLSPNASAGLKNIQALPQTMIPLGIPTDRVNWSALRVSGSYSGKGVFLDDNTGVGSAVVWPWQKTDGTTTMSLGVGGWGLKASDVKNVAGSLH
jgi:hypothetical protein